MIFSCGLHHYTIAFFHLLTHAFFKALLFLTAGALIHYFGGEQDLRKMGAVDNSIPFLSCAMFIGSLALVGFPFLAGYYSKDAILESAFTNYNKLSHFVYFAALAGALITAYYSLRLYYLICFSETKIPFNRLRFLHNVNFLMGGAIGFLIVFSIFSGYFVKDIFTGVGSLFFVNDIKLSLPVLSYTDLHFVVPVLIRFLPSITILLSIFLIFNIYYFIISQNRYWLKFRKSKIISQNFLFHSTYVLSRTLFYFFNKRWFFDNLYNYFFSRPFLNFGYKISYVLLDKGFIENFGPQFLINCFYFFIVPMRLFNSGQIRDNLRVSLIGFVGVIFFLVYLLSFLCAKV
jgi:NADH-ubiquinone oxidoreductase chain 5